MSLIPNIKYKTEFCRTWQEGKSCEKGSGCFFAHGQHELRTIQQNHKDIVSQNSQASLQEAKPHNYKTIFCKFYVEGMCKLGDQCTYAHERREKRKKRASQEYQEQDYSNPSPTWDSYQLYQYYAQAYMYQYPQPDYYMPASEVEVQQTQESGNLKEEVIHAHNSISNGPFNIQGELTFNQPDPTNTPLSSPNQILPSYWPSQENS